MNKYRVYIQQVNSTYYDIYAPNKENAKGQARVRWKEDNQPEIVDIERMWLYYDLYNKWTKQKTLRRNI